MTYRRPIQIEFNHCDPAGIVFYPRYFEMTNSVVENFFASLGWSFARIVREGFGVPTVHLETDFRAPSRLGDVVDFALDVTRVGARSVDFRIVARAGDEVRITVGVTLVWTVGGKAAPWPADLRDRLAAAQSQGSLA